MVTMYRLIGKLAVPCGVDEWTETFAHDNRQVAVTEVGPLHVSTVFLGIDHSFGCGPPGWCGRTRILSGGIYADLKENNSYGQL